MASRPSSECRFCDVEISIDGEYEIVNIHTMEPEGVLSFILCPDCWDVHVALGGNHVALPPDVDLIQSTELH